MLWLKYYSDIEPIVKEIEFEWVTYSDIESDVINIFGRYRARSDAVIKAKINNDGKSYQLTQQFFEGFQQKYSQQNQDFDLCLHVYLLLKYPLYAKPFSSSTEVRNCGIVEFNSMKGLESFCKSCSDALKDMAIEKINIKDFKPFVVLHAVADGNKLTAEGVQREDFTLHSLLQPGAKIYLSNPPAYTEYTFDDVKGRYVNAAFDLTIR
jgi:hypothetical protein